MYLMEALPVWLRVVGTLQVDVELHDVTDGGRDEG